MQANSFLSKYIRYKDIVWYRALAHLKSESRQSYLGYIWFLIEPVLNTLILFLIFGVIMSNKGGHFVVFLLIGLMVWQWFDTGLNEGIMGIKSKIHILSEIYLPKYLFPIVNVVATTWKFLCVFLIVVGFTSVMGFYPTKSYIYLPAIIASQLLLTIGFVLPLAIVTAYFGDFVRVIQSMLRLLFYLSGIFFSAEKIPEELQGLFYLNPIAGLIEAYRDVLLEGIVPPLRLVLYPAVLGLVLCVVGVVVCKYYDKRILKSVAI